MIRSLEDAEKWYESVRKLAAYMKRLAALWDEPAISNVLGLDNRLRDVTSSELMDRADTILDDLDDLAVLVLFSVFEATIRARTEADVDREIGGLQHPTVLSAMKDLKNAIRNGGFGKIMEAYKSIDVDLTEEVNQVRRFRNWVAHGRRDAPKDNVSTEQAINRLHRYLERLNLIEGSGTMLQPSDVTSKLEQPPMA